MPVPFRRRNCRGNRKPDRYPTVEEFFVVAPATVESKTRYGFDWFEAKWKAALGETGQGGLFD